MALLLLLVLVQLAAGILVHLSGGESQTGADRVKSMNDARTSVGQLLVAVGLIGSLGYTARTFSLSRSTQWAERFEKAADQLANDQQSIRTAGIYALRGIAQENRGYWPIVDQILCTYVRDHCSAGAGTPKGRPPADARLALQVVGAGKKDRTQRVPGYPQVLDLSEIELEGADLSGLMLSRVRLDKARLRAVNFRDADLSGASLVDTVLEDANLSNAKLDAANLTRANLRSANLRQAVLDKAVLLDADLLGALNVAENQRDKIDGTPASWPEG